MIKKTPYVIAEIGSNHNGSITKAKEIIKLAKKANCDAVKFQSFQYDLFCEEFYKKNNFVQKEIKKYSLNFDEFKILRNYSKINKIEFGITVFSESELIKAKKLSVDFIKIASMDLNNYPFLEKISKISQKVIISTGFSNYLEIKKAANIFKKNRKKNVIFLHCVGLYPVKDHFINMDSLNYLKKITGYEVGWSDHFLGTKASEIAAIKGAKIIEKHFTFNKKAKGWDHKISADFNEMKKLTDIIQRNSLIIGSKKKKISNDEIKLSKVMRRSIIINKKLQKNQKITFADLSFQRPGTGFPPEIYKKFIGKKVNKTIQKGSILKYSHFKN